jgi:hypothetical protein
MILAKLRGGLSNQMFQYAAARRLAHRHGTELLLDTSWYANPPAGATPRTYDLACFRIRASLATADDLIGTDGVRRTPPRDLPVALWRKVRPRFRFVAERGLAFEEQVLSLPDNVCLFGYWLSEKYFADIAPLIREEFTLHAPPEGRNAQLIETMHATASVSLHVRRGDYVHDPNVNRIHGTCSVDYYLRAVDHISQRVKDARFFVFSDDLEWVEAHLPLPPSAELVGHNQGPRAYEDIRLMSQCRHHIIANSGFSWWGAWLNPRPDKIVCAPVRWFADAPHDTKDVLPPNWVSL